MDIKFYHSLDSSVLQSLRSAVTTGS